MIVQPPAHTYRLGDALPPIPYKTVPWPWGASKELTEWSKDALKYPLGAVITDVIQGHPLVAQIQTHTAYGAHPERAPVPHKGTSVFALAATAPSDSSRLLAVNVPPATWGQVPQDSMSGEGMALPPSSLWQRPYLARRSPRWLLPGTAFALGAMAGGPLGAAAGLLLGLWANSHLADRA